MKVERFGQVVDVDPAAAALDESIVRALRRRGPISQSDLWYRSSAQCGTREAFVASLDRLVDGGHIIRQGTNRKNRFIYWIAPDGRRTERTARQELKPLMPEAA